MNRFNHKFIFISIFLVSLLFLNIISHQNVAQNQPRLIITPDPGYYVLDAGQKFSVKITENTSDGPAVAGANVAIQNLMGNNYTTGSDGRAYLIAPKNKEKITIIATKDGYISATHELPINPTKDFFKQIVNSKYFIIFLALIFLILVILFVNLRQRRSVYSRANEISEEKTMERYGIEKKQTSNKKTDVYAQSTDKIRIKNKDNNKIEEIRIIQSNKKKEIYPVKTSDDDKSSLNEKEKPDDWFKGRKEIKYEIDRLTGEIDEEGKDKWFEGVENLRDKLDEKMKKKGKKENDEKEN